MKTVKIIRGDTWQRAWIIRHEDNTPVDLTGAAARLHVRDENGIKVAEASASDGRLTIQAAAGRIDLLMPKEATNIPPGRYQFDLEVTFPDGRRATYERAVLQVIEDISHD